MAAITPAMMVALKRVLQERFVPVLPPLQGNQNANENKIKQESRAFNAFVMQKLFNLTVAEAASTVVDDFADNGIDAIYYNESNETFYLLQSKLKANEQFKQVEAESFTRGIRLLVEQNLDTFNQLVKDKTDYIENALDHCSHIKLIIAYTGEGVTQTAINSLEQLVNDHTLDEGRITQEILYLNAECIESHLRDEQSIGLVNTRLKLSHSAKVTNPRKTIFGLVRIDDLIKLHNEHPKALYQKNIRYFIGTGRRGVNHAIKETLENNPEEFFYLNNGVTAVCTSIEGRRTRGGTKDHKIMGLSVVNGAQTISSAAQFKEANPEADLSRAQVMMTIIKASEQGGFHKKVTKARNLQNPIMLSNFAALDDNQERLRQEIALFGIEYHYRPQQKIVSDIPVIGIEILAKALACLAKNISYPARLKSEPSQFTNIDSDSYKEIFPIELTGSKAINVVIVFRVIQILLITADKASPSPERLVYRHCSYALASTLIKRFKDKIEGAVILKEDDIKRDISVSLDEIRQQYADQYLINGMGSAHHAFFKRISDTSSLIQRVAIKNQNMAEDAGVLAKQRQLAADDPYNQELSNYLANSATQL